MMKKIRYFLLAILTGIFILAAIVFFITKGQPKITVDYLAEYNRISQPANYDPCQNAAQLYKEAFNSFVKMPKQLQQGDRTYAKWVDDFNNTEQGVLQKWLVANTDCFRKFREASQRPYNWVEGKCTNDNELISITFPNIIIDLHDMSDAIAWDAKVNAAQGKYPEAFDKVLACYRSGLQQYTVSLFSIKFRDDLQKQQMAMETASLIMAKAQVPVSVLNSFQQELQEVSDTHKYNIDFTADKLFLYDILQRTYIYKPNGTGRLSWKAIKEMSEYDISSFGSWYLFKYFFAGPTQKDVKDQIDSYYEQVMAGFAIAPWELNQTQPNYFENIELQQFNSPFFFVWGFSHGVNYYSYYDTQAQLQGLLTSIAVLRFRQDKGHLPAELDELVKAGYLRQLPADPYSDKSLVYSVNGEDFKIYSVGKNFKDDGGKGCFLPSWMTGSAVGSADLVFWPPTEPLKILINRRQKDCNQPMQKTNQP